MSLKKQLAALLNIPLSDIEKAIEADTKIDVSEITVFTNTELEASNAKISEKAKAETVKNISEKIGIDISKVEDLAGEIAKKFSDEDSKKEISSLTEKLTKATGELETLQTLNGTLKSQNTSLIKGQKISSIIPDGYTVDRDDIKDIYLMKSNVDVDESGELFFKNADGTPKVDKKNQVLRPTKEDVIAFLDSRGYTKKTENTVTAGVTSTQQRNVNTKFSGINSIADVEKYAKENNIDPRSQEFTDLVTEIYNEKPDIINN